MRPKLLKTKIAQFERASFDGNLSRIAPIGDSVLVMPDEAAEKTAGNVWIPDNLRERQSAAAETGILVAVGDGAFIWTADRQRPWEGYKPIPGDRVHFSRYSGTEVAGHDGKFYRLMTDNCVGAIDEPESAK